MFSCADSSADEIHEILHDFVIFVGAESDLPEGIRTSQNSPVVLKETDWIERSKGHRCIEVMAILGCPIFPVFQGDGGLSMSLAQRKPTLMSTQFDGSAFR